MSRATTARSPAQIVHLVRHAHAVPRRRWVGDDDDRPLSKLGTAQAEVLGKRLAAYPVSALLSSPARRCLATLAPLGAHLELEVTPVQRLAEGQPGPLALEWLLGRVAGEQGPVVACTHGDVLGGILEALVAEGSRLTSPLVVPKAGAWELAVEGGRVVAGRLTPPPAISV